MPHHRQRHLIPLVLKRLKLWPVVGLLGPRQVGKSTVLRDNLTKSLNAVYQTLDRKEIRERALRHPSQFLEGFKAAPLILDEVQKVPDLFDAIKSVVDEKRIPGRFIISGSTEFSKKTGIRESLTGRVGLFRLYPMTLAESESLKFSNSWVTGKVSVKLVETQTLLKRIAKGGMPGICFLRDEQEWTASFESWLETTCYRDLQQVRGARLSGELAFNILSVLAKTADPTVANVAAELKQDARRIKSHIEALEALFVLSHVSPHLAGVGKPRYYLCDSGLAKHLGASDAMQLKTWVLNEILAQHESSGVKVQLHYYQSLRKSLVDFVITTQSCVRAIVLTDEESPGTYVFRTAQAFLKKLPQAEVSVVAPVRHVFKESKQITVVPTAGMV